MTEASSSEPGTQVTVAFAVEVSVEVPSESEDFDAVAYGGSIMRNAISGWGATLVRLVHLATPDDVFPADDPG